MTVVERGTQSEETYSNIGHLGVEPRQFNRIYGNFGYAETFAEILTDWENLVGYLGNEQFTRAVGRRVVAKDALADLLESPLASDIEVAMDLTEFGHEDQWLIYMGRNAAGRDPRTPVEVMIAQTNNQRNERELFENIEGILDQGMEFTTNFSPEQIDQMWGLWGETFGWSREQIVVLQRKLEAQNFKAGSPDRQMWFSATQKNGEILCAAMAERLELPGKYGNISLVESTEWKTKDGYERKGLMTGVTTMLNAQILYDLVDDTDVRPVPIAECNFLSRSERAGLKAGFTIPNRNIGKHTVSQILIRNVGVGKGEKECDFSFVVLGRDAMDRLYTEEVIDELLLNFND